MKTGKVKNVKHKKYMVTIKLNVVVEYDQSPRETRPECITQGSDISTHCSLTVRGLADVFVEVT